MITLIYSTQDERLAKFVRQTATLYCWEGLKQYQTPEDILWHAGSQQPEVIVVDSLEADPDDLAFEIATTCPTSIVLSIGGVPMLQRGEAFYSYAEEAITVLLQPETGDTIH